MGIQTASQAISNETGPNISPFGFRNRIQNGEININQRAVANTTNTASNLAVSGFNIDRWRAEHYNVGGSFNPNISIKQTADHPVKGSNGYCLEIQCNTTGTTANNVDFFSMSQHIEALNISDVFSGSNAQPMTLSFWVKSNKTGTYCVQLRDDATGTGGYVSLYEYTILQSGVWEKKIINIPKPTYSSMPSTNVSGLGIMFHYASGLTTTYEPAYTAAIGAWLNRGSQGVATTNQTNLFTNAGNYHRMTDVQLEVGTSATPFERKPYQVELGLCQRYFTNVKYGPDCPAMAAPTNYSNDRPFFINQHIFPVPMRATPSVTYYGGQTRALNKVSGYSSGTDYTITSINSVSYRTLGTYIQLASNTNAFEQQYFYYDASAEI